MTRRSLRSSIAVPFVALVALVASACGGASQTPIDSLSDAFAKTAETSFAWEATLDLSDAALEEMGLTDPSSAQALAIAQTVKISGVKGSDRSSEFSVEAMGFDFLTIRTLGESFYMRLDASGIAQAFGFPLPEDMGSQLSSMGMPASAVPLADALLRGTWVGVTGMTEELAKEFADKQQAQMSGEAGADVTAYQDMVKELVEVYTGDIHKTLEDFTTITDAGAGTVGTRYDVRLALHALLRDIFPRLQDFAEELSPEDVPEQADLDEALAETPETLGGLAIDVDGGLVHNAIFDLGLLLSEIPAASADVALAPGDVVLNVKITDHGSAPAIETPSDATTITGEEFYALMEGLSGMSPMGFGGTRYGSLGGGSDAGSDVRNMAVYQEFFYTDNAGYTDSVEALVAAGLVTQPGFLYGACLYGSDAYVVGVIGSDGVPFYLDSAVGEASNDGSTLGCFPDFAPVGAAA